MNEDFRHLLKSALIIVAAVAAGLAVSRLIVKLQKPDGAGDRAQPGMVQPRP